MSLVIESEALKILWNMPDGSIDLIYIDPPFNTGKTQKRVSITTEQVDGVDADRIGFSGRAYKTTVHEVKQYSDSFTDFIDFITPYLNSAWRLLKPTGSLYVHLDWREVHYVKVLLDSIFGRKNFINEIIWAYDYGAKSKMKFPTKHDNILFYAKDAKRYTFNTEEIDREPYMCPGLVTPEKAARGKLPTDVWWHTIVGTNSHEKTGYPTQKPMGVLKRIVTASSNPGDVVLDFFAGSGTAGDAAAKLGRKFIMIDSNPQAVDTMEFRFGGMDDVSILRPKTYDDTNSVLKMVNGLLLV